MENKTTKLTRSADGMFLTSPNPSPVMVAAMESIKRQMAAETAWRERVRAGLEPANQWSNWNISDRDWLADRLGYTQANKPNKPHDQHHIQRLGKLRDLECLPVDR